MFFREADSRKYFNDENYTKSLIVHYTKRLKTNLFIKKSKFAYYFIRFQISVGIT